MQTNFAALTAAQKKVWSREVWEAARDQMFINKFLGTGEQAMIQRVTELTKTDVSAVVDAAIETIIDSVVEGKKVSILGFGSFEPRERSARQGLNPKTGDKIKIPAKRVPAFTAGKLFKDRVQG